MPWEKQWFFTCHGKNNGFSHAMGNRDEKSRVRKKQMETMNLPQPQYDQIEGKENKLERKRILNIQHNSRNTSTTLPTKTKACQSSGRDRYDDQQSASQ